MILVVGGDRRQHGRGPRVQTTDLSDRHAGDVNEDTYSSSRGARHVPGVVRSTVSSEDGRGHRREGRRENRRCRRGTKGGTRGNVKERDGTERSLHRSTSPTVVLSGDLLGPPKTG